MIGFIRRAWRAINDKTPPTPYEAAIKAIKQEQLTEDLRLQAQTFQCQTNAALLESELRKLAQVSGNAFDVYAFESNRETAPIYFKTTINSIADDEMGDWPIYLYAGVLATKHTPYFEFIVGYASHRRGFINAPIMGRGNEVWLTPSECTTDIKIALEKVIKQGDLLKAINAAGDITIIDGSAVEMTTAAKRAQPRLAGR